MYLAQVQTVFASSGSPIRVLFIQTNDFKKKHLTYIKTNFPNLTFQRIAEKLTLSDGTHRDIKSGKAFRDAYPYGEGVASCSSIPPNVDIARIFFTRFRIIVTPSPDLLTTMTKSFHLSLHNAVEVNPDHINDAITEVLSPLLPTQTAIADTDDDVDMVQVGKSSLPSVFNIPVEDTLPEPSTPEPIQPSPDQLNQHANALEKQAATPYKNIPQNIIQTKLEIKTPHVNPFLSLDQLMNETFMLDATPDCLFIQADITLPTFSRLFHDCLHLGYVIISTNPTQTGLHISMRFSPLTALSQSLVDTQMLSIGYNTSHGLIAKTTILTQLSITELHRLGAFVDGHTIKNVRLDGLNLLITRCNDRDATSFTFTELHSSVFSKALTQLVKSTSCTHILYTSPYVLSHSLISSD
ncbi:hypothetical protein [Lutzomyia reovirus 1]|uniref:hypothetical protein n=1 Tax=Lutzomyia reovirus 1 TaxID=1670669 RepID=UPI00065EE5A6|nr:hypothetical protein [Lutzomyia reovirus 1]AKP18612.1 hypothetical protein [Lutzomyia reovirus 1]